MVLLPAWLFLTKPNHTGHSIVTKNRHLKNHVSKSIERKNKISRRDLYQVRFVDRDTRILV